MNLKKKILNEKCKICRQSKWKLIYSGKIRKGTINSSSENSSIFQCQNCKIIKLDDLHSLDTSKYKDKSYRELVGTGFNDIDFFKKYDADQIHYAPKLNVHDLRNKIIADVGCGAGSTLDSVKGWANKTIAIEPSKIYHNSLKKRHDEVFDFISAFKKKSKFKKVDIVFNFHVIEHVENPLKFINEIYSILDKNGKAFIGTPNHNDILNQLPIKNFKEFYYRVVHRWYFNKQNIKNLIQNSKFKKFKISYVHTYSFSNFVNWSINGNASGLKKIKLFDDSIDNAWKNYLEKKGYADILFLELEK